MTLNHLLVLTLSTDIPFFCQTIFIPSITWVISIALSILAILLFYSRIFPTKWMRMAVYITSAWNTVWTISTVLVTIFACGPVERIWNPERYGGHCIDQSVFYFTRSLISTLTNLVVLLLPLPIVWKLQVSTSRKLGLTISFSIGAL